MSHWAWQGGRGASSHKDLLHGPSYGFSAVMPVLYHRLSLRPLWMEALAPWKSQLRGVPWAQRPAQGSPHSLSTREGRLQLGLAGGSHPEHV